MNCKNSDARLHNYRTSDIIIAGNYYMRISALRAEALKLKKYIITPLCGYDIILSAKGGGVMTIKPSTALRNEYPQISELAKASGEPIFITNKGEADVVVLSMEAYEEREKMFRHRDMIYAAEMSRLNGEPTYTAEEVDTRMEELFRAYEN